MTPRDSQPDHTDNTHDDFTLDIEAMDALAPSNLDASIESLRQSHVDSADAWLVRALARVYALPGGADAVLERVRARIAAAPLPDLDSGSDDGISADADHPSRPAHRPASTRPSSRAGAAFRAIAAMLAVALIAGSFLTVLRLHQRAGTSTPTWQDVSITRAHTTQPLNFDPKNGITYAASQTSGNIYACGSGHLWYSADGGATYQPFTPDLPPVQTKPGVLVQQCIISTVPGLPGVFAFDNISGQSGLQPVGYAAPGASVWHTLTAPAVLWNNSGGQIAADPTLLWNALAMAAQNRLAYAVDNWLYAVLHEDGTTETVIATADFGQHWFWLNGDQTGCSSLAVNPVNPAQVMCVDSTSNARAIWRTNDGGKNWNQLPVVSPDFTRVVGASSTAFFVEAESSSNGPSGVLQRYDGDAVNCGPQCDGRQIAVLPAWPTDIHGNPSESIVVTPEGGIYEWKYGTGDSGEIIQANYLAPGASRFTTIASAHTLPFRGFNAVFELGGTDIGKAPALYMHDLPPYDSHFTQPLYRLALAPTPAITLAQTRWNPTPYPSATPITRPIYAACMNDPMTLGAIQPGGLGAKQGSFVTRWGAADVTASMTYFGRYGDSGAHIVGVGTSYPPPNGRVDNLIYYVDKTTQMTLKQGKIFAGTILPRDIHPVSLGAPISTTSPLTVGFCSAAYQTAFPGFSQGTPGLIVVNYTLRANGDVDTITMSSALMGG